MLTIRMQRTGRKGHAQFRVVVQDSRFTPTSGRVVAYLGSYNPHSKATTLDKEKVQIYLGNGAQPSERVTRLLKNEGVKLPSWVKEAAPKTKAIRTPDKLRRNRPPEEKVAEEPAAEAPVAEEQPATEVSEPAETKAEETPEAAASEPQESAEAPAAESAAADPAETEEAKTK
jgi:small subunit ribosomal protein S16